MKANILKIAGVKSEKEFYSKYPTQEDFMKVHGKAFKKAQFGNMFSSGFNPGNTNLPEDIGYTPMSNDLTSNGFNIPNISQTWSNSNPLPNNIPNMNVPQSIGFSPQFNSNPNTLSKVGDVIGKYTGPAGQVIQGLGALKAEKEALKSAKQMRQVSDLTMRAANTKPERIERKYVRPEDIITSGNQLSPSYGTGTNILAKNGKKLKKYQTGGSMPWDKIGDIGSNLGGAIVGQDAGTQIGGTIGGVLGSAFGPLGGAIGKTLGTVAGGLINTTDNKIRKEKSATNRNIQNMALGQGIQGIQSQNFGFMEDGGYIPISETNYLRSGGHLKEYKEPSTRALKTYNMGGELQTHWGGHMEELSQNPYLPDNGITYMPHGQSHEETDNYGRSGIGITYGDNPVEVERKEPIMKLEDGSTGEDNLVVFGNLQIPEFGAEILGDKKAKGVKFKNYIADLSKSETKQNKIIDKSTTELADFNPIDSFDKLKESSLAANVRGGNMRLKEIAETKNKAALLQNAINETAEEFSLDADYLAKGKVKKAKSGAKFSTAQNGSSFSNDSNLDEVVVYSNKIKPVLGNLQAAPEDYSNFTLADLTKIRPQVPSSQDSIIETEDIETTEDYTQNSNPWITAINTLIPTLRPSDAESLNSNQLIGEMYALSQNQVEPVQAQQYSPDLLNPYSISLQDQMNEITAQTRAAQRMAQNNPAAQAMIAAQAYQAINKVKGEELRTNQALADKVYSSNTSTLNDAKLKNLGILDQQFTRQAQAKSNTKAVAQAALNSISDKYSKNELENRTLKTYENLYNYRFDGNGRAVNMNPLAQFNTPIVGTPSKLKNQSGEDLLPIYDKKGDVTGYKVKQEAKSKSKSSRNGSIVTAIKNL